MYVALVLKVITSKFLQIHIYCHMGVRQGCALYQPLLFNICFNDMLTNLSQCRLVKFLSLALYSMRMMSHSKIYLQCFRNEIFKIVHKRLISLKLQYSIKQEQFHNVSLSRDQVVCVEIFHMSFRLVKYSDTNKNYLDLQSRIQYTLVLGRIVFHSHTTS